MDTVVELPRQAARGLAPFSLKNAPALIERVFPAQKVGVETQKERKAVSGQTLTALGSYWKGRKPLVLVRACILASLLPATNNPEADLEIFDALMLMDERGLLARSPDIGADLVWASSSVPQHAKNAHIEVLDGVGGDGEQKVRWRRDVRAGRDAIAAERDRLKLAAFRALPFAQQVAICERAEKVEDLRLPEDPTYAGVWERVSSHLNTAARSLTSLVRELGIARFGASPVVGDPFCGGGSIPFEAARIGCDVNASDLNPVAAMLTWGALNVVGAPAQVREGIAAEQARVATAVDEAISSFGFESDGEGNRAKAFLYCLETLDPQTGWLVPLAPSWVISKPRRCVAVLVPDYARKRFDIVVKEGATAQEMRQAEAGTVRDGCVRYTLAAVEGQEPREWSIPIARLRGDGEGPPGPDGAPGNLLRRWDRLDVGPKAPSWDSAAAPVVLDARPGRWVGGDTWQERLYCIQWTRDGDGRRDSSRPETFFSSTTRADEEREHRLRALVEEHLPEWQADGLAPDMAIARGAETARLLRERGWTHWHHLFTPRDLLVLSTLSRFYRSGMSHIGALVLCRMADWSNRLCTWNPFAHNTAHVFANQALNPVFTFAGRGVKFWESFSLDPLDRLGKEVPRGSVSLRVAPCAEGGEPAHVWIFDPPYADAVHYHEITEFFIAWLRRNPPKPFDTWPWDSRRPLAIQGKGEKFRADMVAAFSAMATHMPDNGLQVCMFTHKDAGVWADMAQIVWGAGLQVTAAWYVSTETTSELKKGGYVQGTVLLVLRKRTGDERAYKDEIVPAIRHQVGEQVRTLMGLNQRARGRRRDESLFSRADIQMAGYAAAMEVLTGVTHIDGVDMTREALRPRVRGERGLVEEMIDLAVQTATELMTPEGIDEGLWERLTPTERFYLTMAETEADRPQGQPGGKLDDYQNFAKAYRADGWEDLMAEKTPNQARLKGAAEFRRAMMSGHPFSEGILRPTLYAINELRIATERDEDARASGDRVLHGLRDHFAEWVRQRNSVREVAIWLGRMWGRHHPSEASAARILAGIIQTERLG